MRKLPLYLLASIILCSGKGDFKKHFSAGKKYLEESKFERASSEFFKALTIKPEDSGANFGYSLAEILGMIFRFQDALTQTFGVVQGFIPVTAPIIPKRRLQVEKSFNDLMEYLFDVNVIDTIRKVEPHLDKVRLNPNWTFYAKRLSWNVNLGDILTFSFDLSGEYDAADANFLLFLLKTIEFILELILTVNIKFSLEDVSNVLEWVDSLGGVSALQEDPLNFIQSAFACFLNVNEDFLGLEPKEGAERWTKLTPSALRKAFISAKDMYSMLITEKDDQSDDIIQAVVEDDKLVAVKIPTARGDERPEIKLPEGWEKIAQNIVDTIDGKKRADWANDIVPVLTIFVVILIHSGAFDNLINEAISRMPPAQQRVIKRFLEPGFLTIDIVTGFITGIIGPYIQFDFHSFFKNPVGLRALLPAWTSDNNFIMEWECKDRNEKTFGLICKGEEETEFKDTPHFTSYRDVEKLGTGIEKIEIIEKPDGVLNPLPYLAFQSPSLNGLLWLCENYLSERRLCFRSDEFIKPGQYEINLFIALTAGDALKSIVGLIEGE